MAAWSLELVLGCPGLHRETLSPQKKWRVVDRKETKTNKYLKLESVYDPAIAWGTYSKEGNYFSYKPALTTVPFTIAKLQNEPAAHHLMNGWRKRVWVWTHHTSADTLEVSSDRKKSEIVSSPEKNGWCRKLCEAKWISLQKAGYKFWLPRVDFR